MGRWCAAGVAVVWKYGTEPALESLLMVTRFGYGDGMFGEGMGGERRGQDGRLVMGGCVGEKYSK